MVCFVLHIFKLCKKKISRGILFILMYSNFEILWNLVNVLVFLGFSCWCLNTLNCGKWN
jgi:hypothetical protein